MNVHRFLPLGFRLFAGLTWPRLLPQFAFLFQQGQAHARKSSRDFKRTAKPTIPPPTMTTLKRASVMVCVVTVLIANCSVLSGYRQSLTILIHD
jgi:hypothetical protein